MARRAAKKKAPPRIKRRIILFSDGTGNSRAKIWKSNVWRLYKALDLSPETNQFAFYDDGVGTSSTKVMAALGGIFGFGLARNVRDLYSFLCRNYDSRPNVDNEIYIFGFSRGAFTARVLAGLICSQGIVHYYGNQKHLRRSVYTAYKQFRRAAFGKALLSWPIQKISDAWNMLTGREDPRYDPEENHRYEPADKDGKHPYDGLIHFMGLWDTVDAYGGPIDELTNAFNRLIWPLQAADRNISNRIGRVCHALALDEQRQSFEPMLINEEIQHGTAKPGWDGEITHLEQERISQVWFNGVHADVGGGYPDEGLALVTLKWMMERCSETCSLDFIPGEKERLTASADYTAKLNDSRAGTGVFYRYEPRNIDKLCSDERYGFRGRFKKHILRQDVEPDKVHIDLPKIHHTVFDRIRVNVDGKVPFNVPEKYAVVNEAGEIRLPPESGDGDWGWESANQATGRKKLQDVLWNKVWGGRVIYYLTVFALAAIPAAPYLLGDSQKLDELEDAVGDRLWTWLAKVLDWLPETVQQIISALPGSSYLNPAFEYYASKPVSFFLLICAFGTLLWFGGRQRTALYDKMALLWTPMKGWPESATYEPSSFSRALSACHLSNRYASFKLFLKFLAEFAAGVVILFFVLAFASRIGLLAFDGSGAVCGTPGARYSGEFSFYPKTICKDTGFDVKEGETYIITIRTTVATDAQMGKLIAPKDEEGNKKKAPPSATEKKVEYWSDGRIPSDLRGWKQSFGWAALGIPIRRHMFIDWYQPIARIGRLGYTRSSLVETELEPTEEDGKQNPTGARAGNTAQPEGSNSAPKLTEEQKVQYHYAAPDSGRLYLYLNDAVLLHPKLISYFYSNNRGEAHVTIDKVESMDQASE